MKNKKRMILTLIVMLAIGFAAISTTLILNGNVGVGTNQDNYIDGVVFDEDSLTSSEGTTVSLSESGRTITFTTQDMKSIGEEAKVNFKIKNYSQYNATLGNPAISCYFVNEYAEDTKSDSTSKTHDYIQIIPGTELNGTTINAGGGSSVESSVTVKQIKSYVGDTPMSVKFQCEINTSASDSETPSIERPIKMPEGYYLTNDLNDNGVADVGDEIQVGTESFYVISHTDSEINALAKYNLKVGNIYTSDGIKESTIQTTEEGYGRQDRDMRGEVEGEKRYGTIKFSKAIGWPYENNETIDIRNEAYRVGSEVTSETMTVLDALYTSNETTGIKGYEKYIQETIPTAKVRLIEKGEIEELVNDGNALSYQSIKTSADTKGYSWLYSTTYWTQSANSNSGIYVWFVYSNGNFHYGRGFDHDSYYGVRPIITIPTIFPEGYQLTNDIDKNSIADIGDEITVGTESFYVISHTGSELNALAKYNLKVGNIYSADGNTKESTIQATEEKYGRQDAMMRGYFPNSEKIYGGIVFSKTKGWAYANHATIDIRNEAYRVGSGVTAETMTILDALYTSNEATGIKGYEEYIQETIPTAKVRLIDKGEIEGLINEGNEFTGTTNIKSKADAKGYTWLYSTSYRTQSANSNDDSGVWSVYSSGNILSSNYTYGSNCGVRPVITIPEV